MKMNFLYPRELKLEFLGDGEWLDEPDEILFNYKGYDCWVRRVFVREPFAKELHYFGGNLCGYVAVPVDHPCYQKRYEDIEIDVHGGLTFGECSDKHRIGFDCGHIYDLVPCLQKSINLYHNLQKAAKDYNLQDSPLFNPTYKNTEYCIRECHSMVDQLINIKNTQDNKNESPNT